MPLLREHGGDADAESGESWLGAEPGGTAADAGAGGGSNSETVPTVLTVQLSMTERRRGRCELSDDEEAPWVEAAAKHAASLRRVLRPSLRTVCSSERCPLLADVDIDKITLDSLRRGGNTHAADRGVERWQRCGHGRWSAGKDERGSSVAMVDLYDQISQGRRLLVTARM